MAAGDLTVTLVGTYATLTLAVAAMDAENLPAATDDIRVMELNGIGGPRFAVIKIVRAAA